MASPQAFIYKPSKKPKFTIIPPKQLFIDLTKEDTTIPSPKFQVSSPSTKDTSSSSIDHTPKSPTLLSSPSTNRYLNSPLSPPPRVPPPPPTQALNSMEITLLLLPITPLDVYHNSPSLSPPIIGHPIPCNLLEAHADRNDIIWLMASMGSSHCLNTRTVRPESSWGNSGCCYCWLTVIHTVEIDIVKFMVEIESLGMSSDEFDKETGSSDGLQPKQADLRCVHALNELHLHEIRVVLTNMAQGSFNKRYKLVPRKISSLKAKQPKRPPPKRARNVGKSKRTQFTTLSLIESPPSDNGDLPSTKLSPRSYHRALKDDPNMSKEQKETRRMFKNLGRALYNFARMLKKDVIEERLVCETF
nr:hypothetical protein [Tanacetum cinerariifolium]GEW51661.1 hypothetical protein [Tanacetum cinerariifolium]